MQILWAPTALADVERIFDHVAQDNPTAAAKLTAKMARHVNELLADNPMIGRSGRRAGTRELVVTGTRYIVAYRVRERLEILAVIHGAREWPDAFEAP